MNSGTQPQHPDSPAAWAPVRHQMRKSDGRRILMVALNYPPMQGSSGLHRTTNFARHLAELGWRPTVLTVSRWSHPGQAETADKSELPGVNAIRAWAVDAKRHLAIAGKYFGWTALPDRWSSWIVSGTVLGMAWCARRRPAVIWSTFPVASSHLIGLALHRATGIPWVADFRDPLVQAHDAGAPFKQRLYARIEAQVVRHASELVFVTSSAAEASRGRNPGRPADSFHVIENGYDEDSFAAAEHAAAESRRPNDEIRLLHSGAIYLNGRHPGPLLDAVAALRDRRVEGMNRLRLVFRAPGVSGWLQPEIARRHLASIVRVEEAIGYQEALVEMLQADGLLLLQGTVFNRQIPAKVYEYLRAGPPMVCLVDPNGETARLLRGYDGVLAASPASSGEIQATLEKFLSIAVSSERKAPDRSGIDLYSRQGQALRLSELLLQCAVTGVRT